MESTMTKRVKTLLDTLNKRYDPENGIAPGSPTFNYADNVLIEAIQCLVVAIEDLQDQVDWLKGQ